jgi:hypothetical protein
MSSSREDGHVQSDGQQLVVRPCARRTYSPGRELGVAVWVFASLLYSLRFHGMARVSVVVLGVAVAVSGIGLMSLSRRRTKLTVVRDDLVFSGIFGSRVLLAEGSRGRVVNVDVAWGNASGRRSRLWLLVNATGRTAIGLNRDMWGDAQLENLRKFLGLPLEVDDTARRPSELKQIYPGSIAWWAIHPAIAASLVIVVVAFLVLGFEGLIF